MYTFKGVWKNKIRKKNAKILSRTGYGLSNFYIFSWIFSFLHTFLKAWIKKSTICWAFSHKYEFYEESRRYHQ